MKSMLSMWSSIGFPSWERNCFDAWNPRGLCRVPYTATWLGWNVLHCRVLSINCAQRQCLNFESLLTSKLVLISSWMFYHVTPDEIPLGLSKAARICSF